MRYTRRSRPSTRSSQSSARHDPGFPCSLYHAPRLSFSFTTFSVYVPNTPILSSSTIPRARRQLARQPVKQAIPFARSPRCSICVLAPRATGSIPRRIMRRHPSSAASTTEKTKDISCPLSFFRWSPPSLASHPRAALRRLSSVSAPSSSSSSLSRPFFLVNFHSPVPQPLSRSDPLSVGRVNLPPSTSAHS